MKVDWQTAATVFGIVALLAGALAVARVSYVKAQIEGLRGDRDDLMARVAIVESENKTLRIDLDAERKKVEVLETVANGRDILLSLTEMTRASINATKQRDDEMIRTLTIIAAKVGGRS